MKVAKTCCSTLAVTICVVAAMPSFGAKPYDAEVEYLEAPVGTGGVPYIDTGLKPADDMGVRLRVAPLRVSADTTVCGAMATVTVDNKNVDWRWYMGFINKTDGYLSWGTSNPGTRFSYSPNTIYDILFNHFNSRNRRVEKVGGGYTFDLPITDAWPSGANQNIYLFAYNSKGTAGNTGNARIYSAQFTQGDAVVMNLVPVIKDGVGYMYDTIGETLLGKVEGSSSAEFTCGRSIIDESVTLDADADWAHLGQLLISSGVTIDLNGHTLKIVGADGEGTITDNSAGDPGLLRVTAPSSVATPVTVTTSGNMTIFRSRKPYDAEVEYLEAPVGTGGVPYIDTGLKPANDMGVRLRVAPLRDSADTTVCGAMATVKVNNKNVDWRWYMGFIKKTDGYLSWGTANPGTRFTYTPNTIYDILFNHFNSRNRRIEKVGGGYTFDLPITDAWPSGANQNIYLFAYNNKGTAGNTGNARIYSAQFTKGNNVVMDLIPVRKEGVGYMYDKVSETLIAKVPTAPLAFTYVNDAADEAYIEGNVTLDADADWTSRGILRIDDYATIDLNGHSLTIAGSYGTGTITNSSATLGEVHFVVPTQMGHTCSAALLGNLKVVKEGAGTLSLNRAGQTFTGGVVVDGGTAKAGASCPENGSYWGAEGGTITVNANATFEFNGNSYFYYKNFVLNGGTLANHASGMSSTYGIGNVTLVADSSLNIGSYVLTYFLSPNPATFDLGGHKLTVNAGAGGQFNVAFPVVNGTVEFETGGYLAVPAGTTSGSASLDLKMTGAAFIGDGALSVSNYLASYTQQWNHGSYQVKVYGTFTPAGVDENGLEYFHGCEMQTGSTIDLSAKTATWDTTATGWNGTGDADGARTVTFADNATVTLDLHGRTLAKGEKIVSWIETPANLGSLRFVLDAATVEAGEELVVTDSGIYYAADEGTIAHAYWTGAIDNDVTKPGNWACTNFMGGAVADGVPGASAAVHVSGEVGFQIPASQPITYDTIVFSNVVLTNDCDWSGLAEWAMAANSGDTVDLGSVDLNGHILRLATHATASDGHIYDFVTLEVTSSAANTPGELHIAVPDASTYLECSGFALSGNVKLVKDGAGRLAMTRANQTFTGGVLIAEGMGYSPKTSYPETGNYWGASNGTITVAANATFDVCGNNDFYTKNFVLCGGTLANSGPSMNGNVGKYGIGNVTLAADSIFMTARNISTHFYAPDGTPAKIDLGGHTLTNSLVYGAQMYIPLSVENGTMVARNLTTESNGGYVRLNSDTSGGSATFNLVMETVALELHGTLSVGNYVARYTGGYNHGRAAIKVYGTFTPDAVLANGNECFHGCEMQNGSFIDLSAKTNAWSSVALGWTGTGNMDGNRTTTFADDATVGILFGSRNVTSEEKIVDWSAAVPANLEGLTFFGQFADGRRTNLKIKDDGLYAPKQGLRIIVR